MLKKMRNKLGEGNFEVVSNIIGAFLVKGVSLIISVLLLPAYIEFFHDEEVLGVWYTILSILNWIVIFDLGLGNGLRNKLPEFIERKDDLNMKRYISTTYILMACTVIVLTVLTQIVIVKIDWINIFNINNSEITNENLIRCVQIVFVGVMLQMFLKIITSILYAIQKSSVVNLLALLSNAIILIALKLMPSRDLSSNLMTVSVLNVVAVNLPYLICTIILFGGEFKKVKPSIRFVEKAYIKEIFNIGITLLWLQLVFMVINSANEILITNFTEPKYVVDYQAYHKIFKTGAMIVSLALTPIWSAITKAQAKKNYLWIKKIYKLFLIASAICLLIELVMVPFCPMIVNIWLGDSVVLPGSYTRACRPADRRASL